MATRTIPLSDLKVGMYLLGVNRSRLHRPFLRHKFDISAQSEIDTMRRLDLAQEPESGESFMTSGTHDGKGAMWKRF
ncbi:MAG TPA: DUF3391 domain-containing protein [Nitrospira sp.]